MRLLPWAAAPRAASSSPASSARSGGRAPRRRGRCIPPLAAAAAATAPRPRVEHPRALPGVLATSFRPLSPQDAGGVCKVLCPSNLLPLSARPPLDPVRAGVPPWPCSCSLASAGRSVPGCRGRARGRPVPPARTRRGVRPTPGGSCPGTLSVAAAGAPPALHARSLALSLAQLVTFHQLSSPAPEPDQWQTRAQAGDPAPSAAISRHPHPP